MHKVRKRQLNFSSRIGDLKRQKMVRTINIYYNNRSVQVNYLTFKQFSTN